MYSVIASDGKSYGPVDLPTLKEWCVQGRVTPETSLVDGVSGKTLRASDLQDLYGIFPAPPQAPPGYGNPAGGYGQPQPGPAQYGQNPPYGGNFVAPPGAYPAYGYAPKSKLIAVLLAFFLGGFGVHRFYLGHNSTGTTMLVLWIVAFLLLFTIIGAILSAVIWIALGIWSIVDIIMILTGSLRDGHGYELTN